MKGLKRILVITPVLIVALVGIVVASLKWLFQGEGTSASTFFEDTVGALILWAEK